jgi:hypothetical protein
MPGCRRTYVRYCDVARVAAVLPGYASIARASEVLHLAPRSVRDLIYKGRLPSLRIGRLHYVRAADLEHERRRRLGLAMAMAKPRTGRRVVTRRHAQPRPLRPRVDPAARRQRAAERAALVGRWANRHRAENAAPRVPFSENVLTALVMCDVCGRQLRPGVRALSVHEGEPAQLCLTCGRRALLQWADQRRLEAAAARGFAQNLGAAEPTAQVA